MPVDKKLIDTPVEDVSGNPSDLRGDSDDVYGGEPGWPKTTGQKMPEVSYDNIGGYAKTSR